MFDIIADGRRTASAEYQKQALAVSGMLSELDVGEDTAVLVVLKNSLEFLVASQAVANLGAYVVPVNWHGTARDVKFIAQDSSAKLVIVHADLLPLTAELMGLPIIVVPSNETAPSDDAITSNTVTIPWERALLHPPYSGPSRLPREPITYTSGSTGVPKGVRRSTARDPEKAAAMRNLLETIFGIQDGTRTLVMSPLYHAAPASYLRVAMTAMKTNGLVVIHTRYDAEEALKAIEQYRINRLWMVPTMFVNLVKLPKEIREQYDLSSLEYIVHSAAPCPPEVKKQILDWFGPVLFEFYGSTEVGPVTLSTPEDFARKPGNVGHAVGGTQLLILDDEGCLLPTGGIGEIACLNEAWPEFTYINRETDRRTLDRGRLVATGDIGYIDEDGFLFLCDRKSHMIISGGVNIYPAEIEAIALEHPAIKDCAVFGIPDEKYGEAIAMAVELVSEMTVDAEELKIFLRERLASYKVPKLYDFVDALPREDSGKIFKRRLRDPYWAGTGRTI